MEVTSNAIQTVNSDADVIFTDTTVGCRCGAITNRPDSAIITLRGGARYFVNYGANIGLPTGATAGTIGIALALQGEPLQTTQSLHTAAAGEIYNVCRSKYIEVPRNCCYTLALKNISSQAITVSNANLIVERMVG